MSLFSKVFDILNFGKKSSNSKISSLYEEEIIPLKERLKSAVPSKEGLFPHEILILHYASSFYIDQTSFQNFWKFYGVKNVKEVLSSLVERNFLQVGSISEALEKQPIAELKKTSKNYGLKISGKKENLIEMLIKNIPENKLNEIYPRRTYSLTDFGKETLKNNEYISYIHKHRYEGLDIWSLNKLVYTKPYRPYRDKIWQHLNFNCQREHISNNNFGLYRNCLYQMSELSREEKNYIGQLEFLCSVVFCDLSGLSNFNYKDDLNFYHFKTNSKSFFPYEHSLIKAASGIIHKIFSCQQELKMPDSEFKLFITKEISKQIVYAPMQIFNTEEIVDIIFLEHDNNKEELKKLYSKAEKEFKKRIAHV